jgi:hypothetical protein
MGLLPKKAEAYELDRFITNRTVIRLSHSPRLLCLYIIEFLQRLCFTRGSSCRLSINDALSEPTLDGSEFIQPYPDHGLNIGEAKGSTL